MNEVDSTNFEQLLDAIDSHEGGNDGAGEFNALLRDDPQAREAWIEHCLLGAMLDSDEVIAEALLSDELPANVVALPGSHPRHGAGREHPQELDVEKSRSSRPAWLAVAAMLILTAIGAAMAMQWLSDFGSSEGSSKAAVVEETVPKGNRGDDRDNGPTKSVAIEDADANAARQAEYDKMLIAEVSPGSLNRPPTPFNSPPTAASDGSPLQRVSFNRDIRPILSENCVECHGPDAASREAELRLDREEDAVTEQTSFEAGESTAPIVRGHPELSELISRIQSKDDDDLMPPADSHKVLTGQQILLLKRWVEEGAPWEEHWAFVAPRQPAAETIEAGKGWGVNAVDHFIFQRLNQKGLSPSQEADRNTLIRRVTLDLTGLPPSPQEVEAFLSDSSDTGSALEKVVDRLLASKAYGEHMARYWLDAARYADTHGLHLDNYREMWPYRDWVIAAYNRNQPFDQFTIEQLAGDLLEEPSQDQLVATGFNRCNVTTSEGGAIAEEFAVRYAIDRVATTSTVWLGLTAGCAQCHDHKYDPISMREFYQLFAYFNNTTQAAMDKNVPDTPPVIRVYPTPEDKSREEALLAARKAAEAKIAKASKAGAAGFAAWMVELESKALETNQYPGEQTVDDFSVKEGEAFTLSANVRIPAGNDRIQLLSQIDVEGRGFTLGLDLANRGIELALFGRGGEEGEGGALKVRQIHTYKPGNGVRLAVRCDGSRSPKGITVFVNGKEMVRSRFPYLEHDDLRDTFSVAGGTPVTVGGEAAELRDVKVFNRSLTTDEIKFFSSTDRLKGIVKKSSDTRSKEDTGQLREHFLMTSSPAYGEGLEALAQANIAINEFQNSVPVTHVMHEGDGAAMAHMLERGEYDKKLEAVGPGVPAALPELPADAPQNRLGLARWLVDGEHPLTARVTVNRFWQQLFGTGLVKTAGDFGSQGEPPSHPELLDWLAVDFVEGGWDVKQTLKQIVMSATYRQSSRVNPELLAVDPENRLLARGPRFRLDAEVIRDQALAASGLLSSELGGPGVRPYQPDGLWKAVGYTNSNTVKFARHHGDRLYRRSVYTFWKRTAPPANMTAFDAPDRESCTVSRERTNTPLQALVLMNDVQFVEAARHLAERGLHAGSQDAIDTMSQRVLGRNLDSAEKAIIEESLNSFRSTYTSDGKAAIALLGHGDRQNDQTLDPSELAALTMVASQLLNLDEAVTKN